MKHEAVEMSTESRRAILFNEAKGGGDVHRAKPRRATPRHAARSE
jgi:hypothetical protein